MSSHLLAISLAAFLLLVLPVSSKSMMAIYGNTLISPMSGDPDAFGRWDQLCEAMIGAWCFSSGFPPTKHFKPLFPVKPRH